MNELIRNKDMCQLLVQHCDKYLTYALWLYSLKTYKFQLTFHTSKLLQDYIHLEEGRYCSNWGTYKCDILGCDNLVCIDCALQRFPFSFHRDLHCDKCIDEYGFD